MKRREFLLLSTIGLSPLILVAWPRNSSGKPKAAPTPEPPEVLTDLDPMRRCLASLGPVISTHWTQYSPGDHSDSSRISIPGPSDYYYEILARFPPGQVAAFLGGRPTTPAQLLPYRPDLAEQPSADYVVPTPLVPYLPANPSWVSCRELDNSLLRAHSSTLFFDRASDTVYVTASNLKDPTKPGVVVDQNGVSKTIPPVPLPPLP